MLLFDKMPHYVAGRIMAVMPDQPCLQGGGA